MLNRVEQSIPGRGGEKGEREAQRGGGMGGGLAMYYYGTNSMVTSFSRVPSGVGRMIIEVDCTVIVWKLSVSILGWKPGPDSKWLT